ncbi:MAG: cysteine desulfurase NifS [Patescibacteria group bacterium]|nr:MAG: cysteine desulfurase NifS [Patescibacteria group bacterium]
MKRIYLDHAAATPLDSRVRRAMTPFFDIHFGNPSALYEEGLVVKEAVEGARGKIAKFLHAHSDEIVFTGSGTESDNLAILGVVKSWQGLTLPKGGAKKSHIVTSVIEHPAVLNVCKSLEKEGVDVTYVGVNEEGIVDPKEVKEALRKETILVSIMYANNEIGTIQPVREIAKIIRGWKKQHGGEYPFFHTDACQAANYLDMNVLRLGVDLLTINGSKIYGPKGVGALYVKRETRIAPVTRGGGQEFGLRSGTENVPGIVGLAEALCVAEKMKKKEIVRLTELRDYFIKDLLYKIPESILNGDEKERLPNNINVSIPNIDSEQLVIELDAKGVSASAASACKSRSQESSYVIMALERKPLQSEGSVRFSLGRETKKKDIGHVLKVLPGIIKKIQV